MTIARRTFLQAGATIAGGVVLPTLAAADTQSEAGGKPTYEFSVKDIVYSHSGGKERLARVYQPRGNGPFPAVLQVHGGAWTSKDRTDGQNASLDLARDGVVVVAIDFRNGTEAPYPASQQDINYGIRWLKTHAREFGSTADRVGLYGTSSGGHQVLLAAIRQDDPRYRALALAEAPNMDAKVAFVVSGWGVLYPLERQKLAQAENNHELVESHKTFFGNDETQLEATPTLIIEKGEKVYLPPAMVFQGTKDQWTTVELAQRLAAAWQKAGGAMDLELYEGERHTFVNDHPFAKNSVKAMKTMTAFVKKYGLAQHASR